MSGDFFCFSRRFNQWAGQTYMYLFSVRIKPKRAVTSCKRPLTLYPHGWYNFRQTEFKDFSRTVQDKSWFSRTKIYAINEHSLTPFLNTLVESFWYDLHFFSYHGWSHYYDILHLHYIYCTFRNNRFDCILTYFLHGTYVWKRLQDTTQPPLTDHQRILASERWNNEHKFAQSTWTPWFQNLKKSLLMAR